MPQNKEKWALVVTQDMYLYRDQGQKKPKKDGPLQFELVPMSAAQYRRKHTQTERPQGQEWVDIIAVRDITFSDDGMRGMLLLGEHSDDFRQELQSTLALVWNAARRAKL